MGLTLLQIPLLTCFRLRPQVLLTLFVFMLSWTLTCLGAGSKALEKESVLALRLYDEEAQKSFDVSELLQEQNSVLLVKDDCEPCLQMLKTLKNCRLDHLLIVAAAGPSLFQAQVRKILPASIRLYKISLDDLVQSTPGTPFLVRPNKSTHFGTLSCSNFNQILVQGQATLKVTK